MASGLALRATSARAHFADLCRFITRVSSLASLNTLFWAAGSIRTPGARLGSAASSSSASPSHSWVLYRSVKRSEPARRCSARCSLRMHMPLAMLLKNADTLRVSAVCSRAQLFVRHVVVLLDLLPFGAAVCFCWASLMQSDLSYLSYAVCMHAAMSSDPLWRASHWEHCCPWCCRAAYSLVCCCIRHKVHRKASNCGS